MFPNLTKVINEIEGGLYNEGMQNNNNNNNATKHFAIWQNILNPILY